MSFLDSNYEESVEPKAVPAGEYEIRIVDIKEDLNQKGNPYVLPRFDIPAETNSKEFTKYLAGVHDGMSPKERNSALYRLKEFMTAFGFGDRKPGGIEELIGCTAWAILGVEDDGGEYGEQNYVKRFVTSR